MRISIISIKKISNKSVYLVDYPLKKLSRKTISEITGLFLTEYTKKNAVLWTASDVASSTIGVRRESNSHQIILY